MVPQRSEPRTETGFTQSSRGVTALTFRSNPATDKICYFRSDTKYTRVVTASQESLIRKSVRELTAELDPDAFWQIHRSVIVNLAEVAGLQRDFRGRIQLRLKHRPETLPVSHPYSHRFHQM